MDLYSINDKGVNLDANAFDPMPIKNDDIRGFFLKSDLEDLLSTQDCVGIRFYNVDKTDVEPFRLIAAAAMADGSEFVNLYLLSHGVHGTNLNQSATRIENDRAQGRRRSSPTITSQSLSFFSKTELQTKLFNGSHQGIAIYNTNAGLAAESDFEPNHKNAFIDNRNSFKTHIAASATLMGGILTSIVRDSNLLSIHPCPGHCINNDSISATPPMGTDDVNKDPYLFKW